MDSPYPPTLLSDWEKFFAEDDQPTGLDLYPEVFVHDVLFPLQRTRETERMLAIARMYEPKCVVEIGADKGGCVYHWLKGLPTLDRLGLCDEREVPYLELFRSQFPGVKIAGGLDSRSEATINKFKLLAPIDVLFIDGEKSNMYRDFEIYLPMMAKRSVVFIHDVNDSYGALALKKLRATSFAESLEVVIDTSESKEAVEREARGVPATTSYEKWLRYWRGRSAGFVAIRLGG